MEVSRLFRYAAFWISGDVRIGSFSMVGLTLGAIVMTLRVLFPLFQIL